MTTWALNILTNRKLALALFMNGRRINDRLLIIAAPPPRPQKVSFNFHCNNSSYIENYMIFSVNIITTFFNLFQVCLANDIVITNSYFKNLVIFFFSIHYSTNNYIKKLLQRVTYYGIFFWWNTMTWLKSFFSQFPSSPFVISHQFDILYI